MKRLLRFLIRFAAWSAGAVLALWVILILARQLNPLFRPDYWPVVVMVNQNGQCALALYPYNQLDLFQLGLLLEGDAFYTVIDLQSGKILRDSTTSMSAIYGMGSSLNTMRWYGNSTAQFPLDNEWPNIQRCGEVKAPPQFQRLVCSYGLDGRPREPECQRLLDHVRRITQ